MKMIIVLVLLKLITMMMVAINLYGRVSNHMPYLLLIRYLQRNLNIKCEFR